MRSRLTTVGICTITKDVIDKTGGPNWYIVMQLRQLPVNLFQTDFAAEKKERSPDIDYGKRAVAHGLRK